MQKFIHDDFDLDLTSYEINTVSENQWFSDKFFTLYTYPFTIELTDETNVLFGLISNYNIRPNTYFEGYFFIEEEKHKATLEILNLSGTLLALEISYGLETFPSFSKKLSELNLENQNLGESLFDHAENVITKTWPEVNYNFPQVHTDSFDPSEDRWTGFEKIINNYQNNAFLLNEFNAQENITYNRNIMIPMPHLLHVLVEGFLDAGYELKGDVMNDTKLQKILIVKETEEYVNARIEGEEVLTKADSYDFLVERRYTFGFLQTLVKRTTLGQYVHEHTFTRRGRYKISGNLFLRRKDSQAHGNISYDGTKVWSTSKKFTRDYVAGGAYVDINIDVEDLNIPLVFFSEQIVYSVTNGQTIYDASVYDVTITPLAIYDENGDLIPPIITTSKLDLRKCVPDIEFGSLVKSVKNWRNLDLVLKGKEVHMNFIEPQMNILEAVSFTDKEVQFPERKFKQGDSYLLQFKELDNEYYNPNPLFVDIDGPKTSGFSKNDDTTEIPVDIVPLPNVFLNDITTAFAVDDGESSLCVASFGGTSNGDNTTVDMQDLLFPENFNEVWEKWLDFRLRSQEFTSSFVVERSRLKDLAVTSKIFMYNNYHIIKIISKTNVPGTDLVTVEFELASIV